jgi:2-keto-3-deoxy-6-phosphogluconate aldolase
VTGGVTIDNFTEYLTAGASLVGISSDLIGGEKLFDLKKINKKAREIVDRLYLYDRAIDSC